MSTTGHRRTWLLIGCLLALGARSLPGGVQGERPGAVALVPGDHRVVLSFGGRERSYLVHVPPLGGQARAGLPVLLMYHGGGSNAQAQQHFCRIDPLADRAGFLVVYPNGTGRLAPFLTWNAGACCGSAVAERVDDVGFTLALLADLGHRAQFDRRRVYASGMSNGAMMAHRLAAEAADTIAAIAPVAGGMAVQRFAPTRPVPVLHIHSVDDPHALYHGGLGLAFPRARSRAMHPDIDQMILRWVRRDGCKSGPVVVEQRHGNGQTATHLAWSSCEGGVEVGLWRLTGAGHVWPGVPAHLSLLLGTDTTLLDANQVIWDFVSRFRLPAR